MTQRPAAVGFSTDVNRRTSDRLAPAVAVPVGLALGVVTAYAQGWLPDRLGSIANSSGSWVVVAFLLALAARGPVMAAVSAAAALFALLAGYIQGAHLQGLPTSSSLLLFWGAAAVVAGPVVGVAANWLRFGPPRLAATGAGVLAGVLIGEGYYGLTIIADTTYQPYWAGEMVVGIAVLGAVGAWRLRRLGPILVSIGAAAVVVALFVVFYSADLIALL